MRRDLMDILACPVCKGDLELRVESESDDGAEVVTGALRCTRCAHDYPIREAIPDLRPPQGTV
jgi:uncharacterized protein YbaR (Trm112 family)